MTNDHNNDNSVNLNADIASFRNRLIDGAEETNFRTSQFFRAFNHPSPDINELRQYASNLKRAIDNFTELLKPYTE